MNWQHTPETKKVTALTFSGDYIISHRPECFTVSYRPTGQHYHVGQFQNVADGQAAAEEHAARCNDAKDWALEVKNGGTFKTVKASKGRWRSVCNLGCLEPIENFLNFPAWEVA
jgi:hypothetical protein